jgi:tetratricopeptide (TPR) repeat protein
MSDVRTLVARADALYWDDPEAARAAYTEAVEAGYLPALIGLGMLLDNVLDDEDAALAAFERAAASGDPGLRAEAMYELASRHVSHREVAAASTMFQRVIDTGHPEWAGAAMVGLAGVLKRGGDPDGAAALCREAAESGNAEWSAHARSFLADVLKAQGDLDGAQAAWRHTIDSRDPEWAGPAFVSLVNMLDSQEDVEGLRAAYVTGAALGNPEALYALTQLGQRLEAQGDVDGAYAAWEQAIEAGCEDAGYWRERMSPRAEEPAAAAPYPPELPSEFNPANMMRTGAGVLEHGLPPLPDVLRYEMAVPVAYWKGAQSAVVLILWYPRGRSGEVGPAAIPVTYTQAGEGTWAAAPSGAFFGGGFSHDPIADPGYSRDLGGRAMVYGHTSRAAEVTPGSPAFVVTGRAAPEVRYLAIIKDGHEDRRPLESYFGAWVVCTEEPGPFVVAGFGAGGEVLARIDLAADFRSSADAPS